MDSDAGMFSYSAVLMGSPILLKLPEHNEPLARNVFRLIKQQEDMFTVNRAHSEVMAVNQAAGQHPVVVTPAVYALIRRAHAVSIQPDSSFNFTIGPLVKRWKIGFQGHSVPPADELRALLALSDPHQVVLDDAQRSVFLLRAGMEIDLGAIAKGYIADRVRDYLRQQGVEYALINLGGNVQTLGNGEQQRWSIGLREPFADGERVIGAIAVEGKSVVTSGVYERYFEQEGRCYHHILDPRTGYPLDNELLSVTVISSDSIEGDIWTTLLYGMGVENGLRALCEQPELEAIFVTRDGRVICSSQRLFSFTLLNDRYRLTGSIA